MGFDPINEIQEELLIEWAGTWVMNPKTGKDRVASQLAKDSIRFTKANSFISPVAVAAIDILGISGLLSRMSLEEVAERFAEPFYDLTGPIYGFGNAPFSGDELEEMGFQRAASVYSSTISDTILLMRRPDWELGNRAFAEAQAVVALAEYVCKIIKINSIKKVPLRAAVSFGNCIVSVGESRALLGLATGEATYWERQQEWIGGMLAPSAVEALRGGAEEAKRVNGSDFSPPYPNTLIQYPVPLKADGPVLSEPQIALNWITGITSGVSIFLGGRIPSEPSDNLAEDVRRKHLNTIAFAAHCEGAPRYSAIDWK